MSEDWEKRWADRKALVQPMIDQALVSLKGAVTERARVSDDWWVPDLCSIGVALGYARRNLSGVEGMTGSISHEGSGIEDTLRALVPLENALMSMWATEDVEIRRALLVIFDRLVPAEIKNLSEDPHGELRYAALCRADADRRESGEKS